MYDFNLNISTLSFKNKIYQTYLALRALLSLSYLRMYLITYFTIEQLVFISSLRKIL